MNGKVRIRLQSRNKNDLIRIRKKFLKDHPQVILSKPREGTNPKYEGRQAWSCYGNWKSNYYWKCREIGSCSFCAEWWK